MDKFDSIEAFVAVAQAGGFSAASRVLGVPVATVSRKIALLEEHLGVRLLQRSTRHVALSDQGRLYFESCRRVLDDLRDADEMILGEYRQPKGDLAITAPLGFGRLHLQPVIQEFLQVYPQININLDLSDSVVSILEQHIDCAVRISVLADSALVARRVGQIRMMVCASPGYLAKYGIPKHPNELAHHDCISWARLGPYKAWEFQLRGKPAPTELVPIRVRLSSTTAESAVDAAIAGLGLVQATSYQLMRALEEASLVPVLSQFEEPSTPVNLVYMTKALIPLKMRAFLDYVVPRLEQRLDDVTQIAEASAPVNVT